MNPLIDSERREQLACACEAAAAGDIAKAVAGLDEVLATRRGVLPLDQVDRCSQVISTLIERGAQEGIRGRSVVVYGQGSRHPAIILQAFSEFLDSGRLAQTYRFLPYVELMDSPEALTQLARFKIASRSAGSSADAATPAIGPAAFEPTREELREAIDRHTQRVAQATIDVTMNRANSLPRQRARARVSILMPFLDGKEYFNEAVQSVFDQTSTDWQIVFVDDGSRDGSGEWARKLASLRPDRISCLQHPGGGNRGLPASRNLAMRESASEYVAMLDIDDYWLPHKLARQIELLDRYAEVALAYGPIVYWYGWTGKRTDMLRDFVSPHSTTRDRVIAPPEQLAHLVRYQHGLPTPSGALLRRACLDSANIRFDESFGMYEDEVFLSQVALRYPVYVTSEYLDLYRQHEESFTSRAMRAGEYAKNRPNPTRGRFLRWLLDHVSRSGVAGTEFLLGEIRHQLEAYVDERSA